MRVGVKPGQVNQTEHTRVKSEHYFILVILVKGNPRLRGYVKTQVKSFLFEIHFGCCAERLENRRGRVMTQRSPMCVKSYEMLHAKYSSVSLLSLHVRYDLLLSLMLVFIPKDLLRLKPCEKISPSNVREL